MPETTITSRQNPLVARFRAAAAGDGEWMLLDGAHLLDEALAAGVPVDIVAADPDRIASDVLDTWSRLASMRVVTVSAGVLAAMSPARTPSGVVALAARPRRPLRDMFARRDALVVAAVDIQDPGNIGAIVRAAEAGGATAVVATTGGADPFGWKALRGAMGSAFRLPVARVSSIDEAVDVARTAGLQVVAAAGNAGTPMDHVGMIGPTLLLLGNEGQGLRPDLVDRADVRASIPMAPPVESLNVAVAAGLLVYEARRQRFEHSREGAKTRS